MYGHSVRVCVREVQEGGEKEGGGVRGRGAMGYMLVVAVACLVTEDPTLHEYAPPRNMTYIQGRIDSECQQRCMPRSYVCISYNT